MGTTTAPTGAVTGTSTSSAGSSAGGAGAVGVTAGGMSTGGGGMIGAVAGSPASAGGTNVGAGGNGAGGAAVVTDTVTRTASTFTFEHYPIETNADDVWSGPESPAAQVTSTTYDTIVLENGYLRVTLLPSYGGRILSIVHKPTNRELLYQNPVGTPYLMHQDIFYYDYLVIMGGIFPSFPEPEHGKYWNEPYDVEIVSETPEAITVRMSRQDDKDLTAGVPERYVVGRTDILVDLEVTLRAGRSNVELATKLTNTRGTSVPEFEYWTVTTLAPGSTPGDTKIPLDTRIMAAMDEVVLLEDSWPWFADAEERVDTGVFKWNNLSHFENWVDQGTGFAFPEYAANWSGLINYENDTGIVRVTEDTRTAGLKLWTFGRDSLNVNMSDPDAWLRPTIEMWHGVTTQFWTRAGMPANESWQWSETYFPTLGMREITAASPYGAMYLASAAAGADTALTLTATLTVPDQTVKIILKLGGDVVSEQDVVVSAMDATTVTASVPSGDASTGAIFEAEIVQGGTTLLSGQVTLP